MPYFLSTVCKRLAFASITFLCLTQSVTADPQTCRTMAISQFQGCVNIATFNARNCMQNYTGPNKPQTCRQHFQSQVTECARQAQITLQVCK
jgi:hypothetical protein